VKLFVDVLTILSQTGNTVVDQIRQNLASTGTNATGKTSSSLRFEVIDQTDTQILRIIGKPFFKVVETGRKPTPEYTKPSKEFVESIKEWCRARGKEEKAAYGIALSIHQKGTKLFRSGGREDIFSNVITDDFVDGISKAVLGQFTNEYLKNVVKITSSGTNLN